MTDESIIRILLDRSQGNDAFGFYSEDDEDVIFALRRNGNLVAKMGCSREDLDKHGEVFVHSLLDDCVTLADGKIPSHAP